MTFKKTKKTLLFSTLALSLIGANAQAATIPLVWTPRSVEEIKADIVAKQSTQTYTIQYGDTLSTIALALGVDMTVLANINQIANSNLIFPETILKVETDSQQEVTSIEIQTPSVEGNQEEMTATVDLEKNEVVVNEQTIVVEDLTEPVKEQETRVVTETQETATTQEVNTSTTEIESVVIDEARSEDVISNVSEEEETPFEGVETISNPVSVDLTAATSFISSPTDYALIAASNPANIGLQPQAAAFKEEVASLFGVTSFSLYRSGDSGDHGKGLAVDFIVGDNTALGDQIAQYAIQEMATKNIAYIIWQQRFYAPYPSIYGPAYTWNLMPDRGSITENHYDHVHVSMNP